MRLDVLNPELVSALFAAVIILMRMLLLMQTQVY